MDAAEVIGWLGGVLIVGRLVPQAVADGLVWGVYGLARRDVAVTWYAALTLVSGAVVLCRIRATRTEPPAPAWQPA